MLHALRPYQLCNLAALRDAHTDQAEAARRLTISRRSAEATAQPPAAQKHIRAGLAEAAIHEAVRDRIAAARRVGEQLQKRDRLVADVLVHQIRIEDDQRVDGVQRRPADEELQHDDEQHLDDALLVLKTLLGVGAVWRWRDRWRGKENGNCNACKSGVMLYRNPHIISYDVHIHKCM